MVIIRFGRQRLTIVRQLDFFISLSRGRRKEKATRTMKMKLKDICLKEQQVVRTKTTTKATYVGTAVAVSWRL